MEKKINSICIITNHYPTESNPLYTFVDQLACEFANSGIRCTVIAPQSISRRVMHGDQKAPLDSIRVTKNGAQIRVFRPIYISFSNTFMNVNTSIVTYQSFKKAVLNEIKKGECLPDILYGHFIFPSGMCAADIGELLDIPSFLSYGESSPQMYQGIGVSTLQKKLAKLNGVIAVSSQNKKELTDRNLIADESMIEVFPNGVNQSKFFRIEKKIARERLGIDEGKFIAAFVGSFIERKGVKMLSAVLDQLEDVHSFFIGSGPEEPDCRNILYKGKLPHEEVPWYLNAADIFVLPTIAEGCCNAIIEAMACGLPVISSDQPFNDDILNDSNSIRLNVRDKDAVREAIQLLKDNPVLRAKMGEGALIDASKLNISRRAVKIVEFMESKIKKQER